MIVCAPISPGNNGDSFIDPRWGRANWVVITEIIDGEIQSWQEVEVSWDRLHDEGTHGSHHARIVKFLKENLVEAIVADHIGDGMVRMLETMKIPVFYGAAGDARAAIVSAIKSP